MKPLRIALTKGRLEKDTVNLLEQIGLDCTQVREKRQETDSSRWKRRDRSRFSQSCRCHHHVENGVCDLGVVGKDTIMENGSHFYEILDLGFGRCRFALACRKGTDFFGGYKAKTVASKYPNVARQFFESRAMDVRIIKIEGSVELAPLLGLADGIVDIVETGTTLKENGLEVTETIAGISARLIANTASLKMRKQEIEALAARMEAQIEKNREEKSV